MNIMMLLERKGGREVDFFVAGLEVLMLSSFAKILFNCEIETGIAREERAYVSTGVLYVQCS